MKRLNKRRIQSLYDIPFMNLIFKAHKIHIQNFTKNEIELCSLLSIKTGGCPEDCSYCPQSAHYTTNISKEPLIDLDAIIRYATKVKQNGVKRLCMGAAWRGLHAKDVDKIKEIIIQVKKIGLETCMTLGMLKQESVEQLQSVGLDYYNHNLDTSRSYYKNIITTRTYDDRLDTLSLISKSNIKACCGGIIGMGESRDDRIDFIMELSKLNPTPSSIPINNLIKIKGTPMENVEAIDELEFIKTIAIIRIIFPKSRVRLSAGRENMSTSQQALCFMAGANSIWFGDRLLTAGNQKQNKDLKMFQDIGLKYA